MSLEFTGWSVSIEPNINEFTKDSDPKEAFRKAFEQYLESEDFKTQSNAMYGNLEVKFNFLMHTSMPR